MKIRVGSIWIDPKTQRKIIIIKVAGNEMRCHPYQTGARNPRVHHIDKKILLKYYKSIDEHSQNIH